MTDLTTQAREMIERLGNPNGYPLDEAKKVFISADDLREAATLIRNLLAEREGRDMDSAPKDGTPILAVCGNVFEMIAWFDGWGNGLVTKASDPCWGHSSGKGERFYDEGWDNGTGCYSTPDVAPTRWLPLPKEA